MVPLEPWMVKAVVVLTILFVIAALLGVIAARASGEDRWPSL